MSDKQPAKFGVVNDQSGEVRDVTLEEFESGSVQGEGFRVASIGEYDQAVLESKGEAARFVPSAGQAKMELQTSVDASMVALQDRGFLRAAERSDAENPQETPDAQAALDLAEETGFFEREDSVKNSTVALAPEEVVAKRNRGKRAMRGELVEPIQVQFAQNGDTPAMFSGEAEKAAKQGDPAQAGAEEQAVKDQAPESKENGGAL